jgi:hypothetical protein
MLQRVGPSKQIDHQCQTNAPSGEFAQTSSPKSRWGKCGDTERCPRSDILELRFVDSSRISLGPKAGSELLVSDLGLNGAETTGARGHVASNRDTEKGTGNHDLFEFPQAWIRNLADRFECRLHGGIDA